MSKATVVAMLIIAILGYFYLRDRAVNRAINSFEDCVADGRVGESYPRQCWTRDGRHFVEKVTPQNTPITITGEITCLPKRGSGAQTMECAFGLKDTKGKYYGLSNLSGHDPEYRLSRGDVRVRVTGLLSDTIQTGPDGNKYDISGVIAIKSIEQL